MSETELATRERILLAAREEFLHKGYQNAWLRDISQKAGVTTGALYGYFKSKEDLFGALVDDEYHFVMDMYTRISEEFCTLSPLDQLSNMAEYTARGMHQMATYMYDHWDAFKLILCQSEGTSYNNLLEDMVALDIEATLTFSQTCQDAGVSFQPVNPTLARMLSHSKFSIFFDMVVQDLPWEEVSQYIDQLLMFYMGGWEKLWGC